MGDEHEDYVETIRSGSLPRILLYNVLDLYSVILFLTEDHRIVWSNIVFACVMQIS